MEPWALHSAGEAGEFAPLSDPPTIFSVFLALERERAGLPRGDTPLGPQEWEELPIA